MKKNLNKFVRNHLNKWKCKHFILLICIFCSFWILLIQIFVSFFFKNINVFFSFSIFCFDSNLRSIWYFVVVEFFWNFEIFKFHFVCLHSKLNVIHFTFVMIFLWIYLYYVDYKHYFRYAYMRTRKKDGEKCVFVEFKFIPICHCKHG